MIQSSDIAMICYINNIIDFSRNNIEIDLNEVILILTFLGDNITLGLSKIWLNKEDFLNTIQSLYITNITPFYLSLNRKLNFESIDDFINLMDLIPELLIMPSSIDPNGVLFPFMFKYDSLIGIYLRTIYAKWNLFQFGEISKTYEEYLKFCSNDRIDKCQQILNNQSKVLPAQSIKYQKPSDYLINAENAINNHDLLPAIESIHSYFDYNGTDPLRSKGDIISQTTTTIENYLTSSHHQKFRYQQAMLTLANMWIRNGYFFYANTAAEEGMKMAHQLGDHTSVTYALLLLHHIIQGQEKLEFEENEENEVGFDESNQYVKQQHHHHHHHHHHDNNSSSSNNLNQSNNSNKFNKNNMINEEINQETENILIRCIQKSVDLKLKSLEIQSIHLLIRHRMKGCLKNCVESRLGYTPLSITLNPQFSINLKYKCDLTPYMIWALLQSTYSNKQSSLFLTSNQTKSAKSNIQGIQSQQNQSLQSNENHIVTTNTIFCNKIKLLNESFLIMSDIWNDLNIPTMSLLTCFRSIKQCGVFLSMNDFVIQLLKYCEVNLEVNENEVNSILYNFLFLQKYSNNENNKFKFIIHINIKKIQKIIQNLKLLENILNNIKKVQQVYDNIIYQTKLNIEYLSYLITTNQHFLYYLIELLTNYSIHSNNSNEIENFMNNIENENLNNAINNCETLINYILSNFKTFHVKEYYLSKIYHNFIYSFINFKISLNNFKKLEQILIKNNLTKLSQKLKIIKSLTLIIHKVLRNKLNNNNNNNNYKINDFLFDVEEMKEICTIQYKPDVMAILSHIPQEILNEWNSE